MIELGITGAQRRRGILWSPEMVSYLKQQWTYYSGSILAEKINEKFGTTFSRNAVIGQAHRKELPTKNTKVAETLHPRRTTHIGSLVPTEQSVIEYNERRRPYGVQLIQLEPFHCRYGVGDPQKPGFFFCAANATGTYCDFHHRLCHA